MFCMFLLCLNIECLLHIYAQEVPRTLNAAEQQYLRQSPQLAFTERLSRNWIRLLHAE